jgi:hypothetical protein
MQFVPSLQVMRAHDSETTQSNSAPLGAVGQLVSCSEFALNAEEFSNREKR